MSEHGTLTVKVRSAHGKGPARRLRASGLIPAVVYGAGKDNVALSVDPRALKKAMNPKLRYNTLFRLTVQQEGAADVVESCLVADYDVDATRGNLVHVDFVRVDPTGEVERKVPVTYTGRAAGVALGGRLKTFLRYVRVAAPAAAIPEALFVDVTPLKTGDSIRVGDVSLEGGRVLERDDQTLAAVEQPKAVKEEEPAEAAAAAAPAESAAADKDKDKDKDKK